MVCRILMLVYTIYSISFTICYTIYHVPYTMVYKTVASLCRNVVFIKEGRGLLGLPWLLLLECTMPQTLQSHTMGP